MPKNNQRISISNLTARECGIIIESANFTDEQRAVFDKLNDDKNALASNDSMLMSLLGIKDVNGNIDVHKIADRLKANMPESGLKVDVKVWGIHLGDMTLHRGDVDTLLQHIESA